MKLVDRTLHVDAPLRVVYALLTDATQFVRWMVDRAEIDPRPGGVVCWTHANGDRCSGAFLELDTDRRIVFTYGRGRAEVGVPPGSTTVEITLGPSCTGTELRLVHRGLAGPMADAHAGGWDYYLARVNELVEADRARPFAPAGRRFREWAAIPASRSHSWKHLIDEALAFVGVQPR